MATELRNTGISVVGPTPWGTHFCHFYETKQDLLDTVVPYFKAGLESKEFCLWVISDSDLITVEEANGALAQAVPDLDRHLSEGNIEVLNGLDWYLKENVISLERVVSAWDAKLKRALALGHDGMRVAADTFWLRENDWKDFCSYEKQINESFTDRPITLLCTYPLAKSGAAEVLDVAKTHQFAIARRRGEWEVIESPELIQARAELSRLNEQLEKMVAERTKELAAANEELKREVRERAWAEDELRKKKEILQKVFDNVPVMIAYVGVDGFPKLFNREWERTIGWSLAEIEEENLDVIAECFSNSQDRQNFREFISAANGEWKDFKVKVRDGRIIDMTAIVVRLLDGTSLGIGRNTTERKKAEALLHAREQEFRAIVENAPDQIIRYDREFRRTYVNPAVAGFYGLPAETLIGKLIGSNVPEAGAEVKEDEVAQVRQRIADVFNTGKTYDYELTWTMPTGRRYFSIRLFPEVDLNGSIVNVLGISRDITERKQAEEKLKQSERQLAEAQRLAHVGSFEWDLRSNAVTWSEELYRIFGLQPGGINVAGDAMSFIHSEDRDLVLSTVMSSVKNKEPYSIYYRVLRPDGDERIVYSRGHVVSDDDGEPITVFGASQDVTALKRAEEKLKATSAQLRALSTRLQSAREEEATRIAREIHDELGSSLTRLKWDLELIAKEHLQGKANADVARLRQKVTVMAAIIDDTVDAVRRISAELRPSVLDDLGLAAALRLQTKEFQDRTGIITDCDCFAENLGLNQEQSTALFRVFEEALTNVMRHAGATKVDVLLEEDNGDIILAIRDDGQGITEAEMLAPLSLGLLGMRERVNLIGGEVNIAGTEGKGTIVTVRLPTTRDPTESTR